MAQSASTPPPKSADAPDPPSPKPMSPTSAAKAKAAAVAAGADAATAPGVGDKVLVNGKAVGVVRYIGRVHFASGVWVGVQLNRPTGLIDGTVTNGRTGEKRTYFTCKANYGVFVRPRCVQVFDASVAAAVRIQAASRGYAARVRLDEALSFTTFTELDEDLERVGVQRALKLANSQLDTAADAIMVDIKQIDAMKTTPAEWARCPLEYKGGRLTYEEAVSVLNLFKARARLPAKATLQLLWYFYDLEVSTVGTVVDLDIVKGEQLTVVGDLHGQWEDLMTVFAMNGLPSQKNRYLFNGDIVDRGPNGLEVALVLMAFRLWSPKAVSINRGNHECYPQNFQYGFADEVLTKYNADVREKVFWTFQRCFKALPLATVLNKKVFVCHGGLFRSKGVKLDHIRAIERQRDIPPVAYSHNRWHDNLFEDLMWSDPQEGRGVVDNTRGAGVMWGYDYTKDFLLNNHLGLIVRSHEPPQQGHQFWHNNRVVTIFSASSYCGQANRGAYMTFSPELNYAIHSYIADRPDGPQIQASMQREMARTVTTKMIIECVCAHKAELYAAFEGLDTANTGLVSKMAWAWAMEQVTQLHLPWLWVAKQVCKFIDRPKTLVNYGEFLDSYSMGMQEGWQTTLINRICRALYARCSNVTEACKFFNVKDTNKIPYQEFIAGVRKLDTGLTDGEVFELLRDVDKNRDGHIDIEEFRAHFGLKSSYFQVDNQFLNEALLSIGDAFFGKGADAREIFARLDQNSDRTITQEEFTTGIQALKLGFTDEQCKQIFTAVAPKNGRLDPDEFIDAFYFTYQRSINDAGSDDDDEVIVLHTELPDPSTVAATAAATAAAGTAPPGGDSDAAPTKPPPNTSSSDGKSGEAGAAGADGEEGEDKDHIGIGGYPKRRLARAGSLPPQRRPLARRADGRAASLRQLRVPVPQLRRRASSWIANTVDRVILRLYECRMSVQSLCRMMDKSGDGMITRAEFKAGLRQLGLLSHRPGELTELEVDTVLDTLDKRKTGRISYSEFSDAFKLVDHRKGLTMAPSPIMSPSPNQGKGMDRTDSMGSVKGGASAASGGAGGGAGAGAATSTPTASGGAGGGAGAGAPVTREEARVRAHARRERRGSVDDEELAAAAAQARPSYTGARVGGRGRGGANGDLGRRMGRQIGDIGSSASN